MENGRDKRRLAAILAADIVGYRRLSEATWSIRVCASRAKSRWGMR